MSAPLVVNGVVYATNDYDAVHAFDARSGKELWVATVRRLGVGFASPDLLVAEDGFVFVTIAGALYAFPESCRTDGGQCEPGWIGRTKDFLMSYPIAANGMVYVKSWASPGCERNNTASEDYCPRTGQLQAFAADCGTGGVTCSPESFDKDIGWGDVFTADGVVYSTSVVGDALVAYPASCICHPLWKAERLGTPISAPTSPIAQNSVAYVPTDSGTLYAFAATCGAGGASCKPIWSWRNPVSRQRRSSVSPPTIEGGKLYVTSLDGKLYAFGVPSSHPARGSGSTIGAILPFMTLLGGLVGLVLLLRRGRGRSSQASRSERGT